MQLYVKLKLISMVILAVVNSVLFPGVAIQWGPIGDVGVVFEGLGGNEAIIGGTLPQRLSSCLASMDLLLHQPHPVVSSHVLSRRKAAFDDNSRSGKSVVEIVAHILGTIYQLYNRITCILFVRSVYL